MDYSKIKAEYIAGGTSYRKLAEKYEVPITTLKRIAKKENWVGLRAQTGAKVDTKIAEKISTKKTSRAARIVSIADKLLSKMENTVDQLPALDGKSMKSYVAALKDLQSVYGISASKLDEKEQKARIANLQRQAEKDDGGTDEIRVVFDAGPEEWNE